MEDNEFNGIFLVNKPLNWSSFKVVDYLKRKFKLKKIGHAGTLDPLATGLLIILVGKAAKRFDEFQKMPKSYEAVIEFGRETDTLDREGRAIFEYQKSFSVTKKELEAVLKKFKGEIMQTPPAFSALKIKGQPAYKLARRGEAPELKPRPAIIHQARILEVQGQRAKIFFNVSSGTYIRSLSRDIGRELGYGAYLYSLKRTAIGDFKLRDAKPPEKIGLMRVI